MTLEASTKKAAKRWCSAATECARLIVLMALAGGLSASAQATLMPQTQSEPWRTECMGYYTMQLPGALEYGGIDPAKGGWGFASSKAPVWGMLLIPDTGISSESEEKQALYVSRPTTPDALKLTMDKLNAQQEQAKQFLIDRITWLDSNSRMDKTGDVRSGVRDEIAALRFYKPVPGMQAVADDDGKLTTFYVYVNSRVIEARRPSLGSTTKTVEAFLQQYSSREPFALPSEPGVCLPYGFYRGEKEPASVGVTFTFIDHPDIVINVVMFDALDNVKEPRQALMSQLRNLVHADEILPLDGRLRPSRAITIDGHKGLGHFALVRREVSKPGDKDALDNPYTKDHSDWVYVAYVPGLLGGKPGEFFNIQIRVERFGRFAKEPLKQQMTEKQFRALAKRFVESIHRRPGAWVAK